MAARALKDSTWLAAAVQDHRGMAMPRWKQVALSVLVTAVVVTGFYVWRDWPRAQPEMSVDCRNAAIIEQRHIEGRTELSEAEWQELSEILIECQR